MKNSTRILFTLVLGATLFAVNGYPAEEKSKQATVTDGDVQAAWQRRIAEIDLGDQLPLSEVSKNLGERFREVNFVVPASARDEPVPRLVLRNVTLGEILKAIELASEGHIRGGVPSEIQGVDAAGLPIRTIVDNSKGNLVAFSVGPLPGSPPAAPAKFFSERQALCGGGARSSASFRAAGCVPSNHFIPFRLLPMNYERIVLHSGEL